MRDASDDDDIVFIVEETEDHLEMEDEATRDMMMAALLDVDESVVWDRCITVDDGKNMVIRITDPDGRERALDVIIRRIIFTTGPTVERN